MAPDTVVLGRAAQVSRGAVGRRRLRGWVSRLWKRPKRVPELPDIVVYAEAVERLAKGRVLESVRIRAPFLLRTVQPPLATVAGRRLVAVRRLGKRIVLALEGDLFLVIHLMVAGRLAWKPHAFPLTTKLQLAAFDFENGSLLLTEAGTQKRASLHVVDGASSLSVHDRGGLEPLECTLEEFAIRLRSENHTLKRSLTDPRLLSGIGNAYSDEILHRARLSPLKLTSRLGNDEIARLHEATRSTLVEWTARLRKEAEASGGFPGKVTAFREGMAVHGRFRLPCPECGSPVQRIRYASNETNYCARCQTGGRLLADRAMSRLLRQDWPRSLEELDQVAPAGAVEPS